MSNPVATEFFNKMRQSFLEKMPPEEIEKYQKFGEMFYNSFNVDTGCPNDPTIHMEEALAFVVESLKSGLHPKHLTLDEATLVKAGYGDEWYTQWGYTKEDVPDHLQ